MGRSFNPAWWAIYVWVLLLGCQKAAARPEGPSPQELLQFFEQTVLSYEREAYRVGNVTRYYGSASPQGAFGSEKTFYVWKDGEKLKYVISVTVRVPDKGKTASERQLNEWIFPDKGSITVMQDPDKKSVRAVMANLDEVPASFRNPGVDSFAIVHGYFGTNGSLSLPQVFRESKLTARKDRIKGKDVWVLEGDGPWGYHSL